MTILAIDYGTKRVGVAISEGIQARKLTTLHPNETLQWLGHFLQTHQVTQIIIGMPQGYLAQKVRQFGAILQQSLKLPVTYWDETLSSRQAQENIIKFGNSKKMRAHQDAHAAAIILQSYLDNS